jgi:hypothetical protein
MNAARSMHSAALMLDGRVLIVGGHDTAGNALLSGEIFDTASGSFSTVAGNADCRSRACTSSGLVRWQKFRSLAEAMMVSMEIYDPSIATFGAYRTCVARGRYLMRVWPSQVQSLKRALRCFHKRSDESNLRSKQVTALLN